jgi:hypothetical protein
MSRCTTKLSELKKRTLFSVNMSLEKRISILQECLFEFNDLIVSMLLLFYFGENILRFHFEIKLQITMKIILLYIKIYGIFYGEGIG